MQIGRRIYYDKATGNLLQDTGERSGDVMETTVEQDFEAYAALAERVPETVGCLQLEYGEREQDFRGANDWRVDITGETPQLVFFYPDPENPEAPPVYRKPLTEEIAELKAENTFLKARDSDLQDTQNVMLEAMIMAGLIE